MKFFRNGLLATAIMALTFAVTPSLQAEDGKSEAPPATTSAAAPSASPAVTPAEVSSRMQELQDQMDRIQSEMANLKKQLGVATTPSATPAPAGQPGQTDAAPATPAAQTAPPAAAPPAAPPSEPPSALAAALGPMSVTGFIDGYYQYDLNHPHAGNCPAFTTSFSAVPSCSTLRLFDAPTDQFSLNMIELTIAKAPDAAASRLGYDLTFGFGNAMNVVNSTDPGGLGFSQYVKEAYLSYLAPVGKGLQIDFGKFVTTNGAEVIETNANWNYSRSLLFNYAIPFYHFGLRAKYNFNDKFNVTGLLVNGWNNIVDNNTGKTLGVSLGWNPNKKWAIVQNYYAGPEEFHDNSDWRQLTDTVVTYTATSKLTLMANYDYGRGDVVPTVARPVAWQGVAAYGRYAFNDRYAFAVRGEYFDDRDGFNTGTAQNMYETTFTFERIVAKHLITRWEYRRDMSSRPVFVKGLGMIDHQDTFTGGLIYSFDVKDLK